MPLDPEVLNSRINLRVAMLRLVAASMFVQPVRHEPQQACPPAAPWRAPRRRPRPSKAWPGSSGGGFFPH
jgi:hypothetical protein